MNTDTIYYLILVASYFVLFICYWKQNKSYKKSLRVIEDYKLHLVEIRYKQAIASYMGKHPNSDKAQKMVDKDLEGCSLLKIRDEAIENHFDEIINSELFITIGDWYKNNKFEEKYYVIVDSYNDPAVKDLIEKDWAEVEKAEI